MITLAPSAPPIERREVARKVASLTLALAITSIVVLTCLWLIVSRRIRRRFGDTGRSARTRHTDAWAEAGRRAHAPPPEALEREEDKPHG